MFPLTHFEENVLIMVQSSWLHWNNNQEQQMNYSHLVAVARNTEQVQQDQMHSDTMMKMHSN